MSHAPDHYQVLRLLDGLAAKSLRARSRAIHAQLSLECYGPDEPEKRERKAAQSETFRQTGEMGGE